MKTATPANRPAPTRQGLAPQTAAAAPLVTYKDINGNEIQLSHIHLSCTMRAYSSSLS